MLLNMHIKNIALIDEIDISFDDKLNVLTGETGAGKSIIIGSLGIGLGGKFSKELLRDEQLDGLVELLFTIDSEYIKNQLEDLDISTDDNEVLISRRLSSSGRSINRINDVTVTTAKLKEVAAVLIDLHAQHEQQTLLKPVKHMEILDTFGKDEIFSVKSEVEKLYKQYIDIENELKNASMGIADREKQMDYLKYQINEIKAANLKIGEDEILEQSYKRAVNSKEILTTADEVYRITGYKNQDSCAENIGRALNQMKRILDLDENLSGIYDILQDIDGMLNDFNRELSCYMRDMEFDSQEFASIENRLNLINSLKTKYGNSIDDILDECQRYEEEYAKYESYDEYLNTLNANYNNIKNRLDDACNELTSVRKSVAERLCILIKESLSELNFMTVEFDMRFNKLDKYTSNGNDEAIFVISTNIGETLRPLYEIASGGELSRIMLALKSCLAFEEDTPTLIFDEIDVGISGRTAQKVAKKMSVIGRKHQVICITHLPQIAAMADSHYIIEKKVENNKTITNIRKIDSKQSINEIARLIQGAEITESTILNATEMKGLAEREKIY